MTPVRSVRGVVAAVGAALVLVGCTPTTPTGVDETLTTTRTLTAPPSTIVPVVPRPLELAALDTPPQPPGQPFPAGEVERSCPYIRAGLNVEPAQGSEKTFADIEGSRVQRVAVLDTLTPAGCRFFWFSDYHPTGDILPSTYPSATEAHNAMVVTAEAGTSALGVPSFVPGLDGISFRTRMNAPDAGQDWAFAFAKGRVMVVVRTDQTDTSANARLIAAAIVGRF